MNDHKRTSRNQWIWSAGLLLAGVAAFWGGMVGPAWSAALPFVATILVVASAATAIGAVASGSQSMDSGKRGALLWSSTSLALGLAASVITVGAEVSVFASASPVTSRLCATSYEHPSAEGCEYSYAYIFIGIGGILAIATIIALLGAVISGLINAARSREYWWFVAILIALFVALSVVTLDPLALSHPQWEGYSPFLDVQGWLIPVAPLLLSILMALFSLSSARQPARSPA